ncbi:MAG: hypothetical protein ACLFQR_13325 [Desulfovibrionales bacterium]
MKKLRVRLNSLYFNDLQGDISHVFAIRSRRNIRKTPGLVLPGVKEQFARSFDSGSSRWPAEEEFPGQNAPLTTRGIVQPLPGIPVRIQTLRSGGAPLPFSSLRILCGSGESFFVEFVDSLDSFQGTKKTPGTQGLFCFSFFFHLPLADSYSCFQLSAFSFELLHLFPLTASR